MLTLDNDIFKLVSQSLKYERLNKEDEFISSILQLKNIGVTHAEYKSMVREVRNFYKRLQRCREKLSILLKKPCWFYTFTFTDDVLSFTSPATRRRYISRILKNCNYIANVDYGKKNGREHYHAVADCLIEDYPYGFYTAISIRLDYDCIGNCTSLSRLSKYIAKLSNHSLKDTTGRSRLMYSRKLFP